MASYYNGIVRPWFAPQWAILWCVACGGGQVEPSSTPRPSTDASIEWFVDRAAPSGLDFIHFNGMTGELYTPEIMGSGVALFDYDNDGDLDVYLVQGARLGDGIPLFAPPKPLVDRLYRNDLAVDTDGEPTLRFTDVTNASGIYALGYGQGVATGDYDNDGWIDLYVTQFGPNQLWRNQGDGTFADVTQETGTGDPGWSVPASFVDFDRDGSLDLVVANYLSFEIETHVPCRHPDWETGKYCDLKTYRSVPDRLYRNLGNGTFVDATAEAGVADEFGPGLGVATADVDGDGWVDIFVANDEADNQLWMNQGDGTFRNAAMMSGVALGARGDVKADMGVDFGDFDNDGDEDLFVTELTGQGTTLYVNDGTGLFEDRAAQTGIKQASLPYTGFGAAWFDIDNDGWLDALAVNGPVLLGREPTPDDPFPLDQKNQLFRNLGDGQFEDVTDQAGNVFELSEVSRGAAFGDVDNDGDTDVVVTNAAGPVRLLINQVGTRHHWLGLRLVGGDPARDMVGARVVVTLADGSTVGRRARADGSYASANDPRVLIGLGSSSDVSAVRVTWPSGRTEEWHDVPVDRYTTLTEGTGG